MDRRHEHCLGISRKLDADTKGGIDVAQGSDSKIINKGRFYRAFLTGMDTTKFLKIVPEVTADDASKSILELAPSTRFEFVGKYKQSAGTFKQAKNSHIKGFEPTGGKMSMLDSNQAGTFTAYVDDNHSVTNTTLEFVHDYSGSSGVLSVAA